MAYMMKFRKLITGILKMGSVEITSISTSASLGTSDAVLSTQKAVKSYVDNGFVALPSGAATNSMMYYNGTTWVNLAAGASGQTLKCNSSGVPTWTT